MSGSKIEVRATTIEADLKLKSRMIAHTAYLGQ